MSRSRELALPAVVLALIIPACGSGSSNPASSSPGATIGQADTSTRPKLSSIDPNFDFGQNVIITPTGFRPRALVSVVGRPIVWWNGTDVAQTIVFDHQPVRSKVVPPGGRFVYTPPNAESATYHSGTEQALRGQVQVTPAGTSQ